jgi:hypothetical protein
MLYQCYEYYKSIIRRKLLRNLTAHFTQCVYGLSSLLHVIRVTGARELVPCIEDSKELLHRVTRLHAAPLTT